ncbi:MAG: fumarylacetoacetate hydrolase family protein [Candidatus Porifericomitaceae bacterium WSBS_2022_MAG_OTU9]
MKLATCSYKDQELIGILEQTEVVLPSLVSGWAGPSDMLGIIAAGLPCLDQLRQAAQSAPRVAVAELKLLAPIPRPPRNIICLGMNYLDHLMEINDGNPDAPRPEHLIAFTKAATCVCGQDAVVPWDDSISKRLDWEVELGMVIGKPGHKISRENAMQHVFGYTIVSDITARDLQKRHQQFYLGKSLRNSCPIGPCIVTADEFEDPQKLRLICRVNGETKQDGTTADQIFDLATTISVLSRTPDLLTGDIIATGTPGGVGFARKPPEYLQPQDVVECEIEGIGVLRHSIGGADSL